MSRQKLTPNIIMKTKTTLLCICFSLVTLAGFSQKKDAFKSIISNETSIKKYHTTHELKEIPKGKLLELYMERIDVLTKIIPYIAFATKPGVTMSNLGIPNSNENIKKLVNQHKNTESYIEETADFQKTILPYADTNKLIAAVLFYEDIMKSINSYDEFN